MTFSADEAGSGSVAGEPVPLVSLDASEPDLVSGSGERYRGGPSVSEHDGPPPQCCRTAQRSPGRHDSNVPPRRPERLEWTPCRRRGSFMRQDRSKAEAGDSVNFICEVRAAGL